ncbi:DUF4236 domain-containing protein [Piscinibacter sp. Jin2]|uniref:DUF4236 domain-containing protein n=1 Tax=Aquariibacter lacus TaxID=2801332 RepID=A0A9X1BNG0_9BURK|nr:DUF4236 domain-containing protein [Piscinibacter lacus]MBL0719807.1 DUF4236 domain-containing protein [Piscinibacter lacus]
MGFRFYKSFPIGKLLRVNVSKSGLSLGIGPPGLNLNIGRRGMRRTVGIPGSGLSWQDSRSWKTLGAKPNTDPQPGRQGAAAGSGGVILGVLLFLVLGAWLLLRSPTPPAPVPAVPWTARIDAHPPKPPEVRALARAELHELQRLLNQLGHPAGQPDGLEGPRTRAAVRSFLRQHGLERAEELDTDLLRRVRAATRAKATH